MGRLKVWKIEHVLAEYLLSAGLEETNSGAGADGVTDAASQMLVLVSALLELVQLCNASIRQMGAHDLLAVKAGADCGAVVAGTIGTGR
jgi:hypothetical protein